LEIENFNDFQNPQKQKPSFPVYDGGLGFFG
jgi:hypothetical protein